VSSFANHSAGCCGIGVVGGGVVRSLESRSRLALVVEGVAWTHRIGKSFVSYAGTGTP
jgi:hypothetical protein